LRERVSEWGAAVADLFADSLAGDQTSGWASPRSAETAPQKEGDDEVPEQGAVRLVLETGKPIAQVARELGVNDGPLK
jgi:hypothetical protein